MARLEDGESRGWWRPIDRFPAGGIVGESSAILKREMIARWNIGLRMFLCVIYIYKYINIRVMNCIFKGYFLNLAIKRIIKRK